jgi:DNA-binding transcriptional LysR family regulator
MQDLQNRSMVDWDDLRIFLMLARSRSAAVAARNLGIDPTTIGRRMTRLAGTVGAPLFETVGGNRQLTERGLQLYAHAEAIENEALSAFGGMEGQQQAVFGQVRLGVSEGLATWVLAPHIADFQRAHPNVQIDLVTSSGLLNPSKREADIAVMLARPRSGKLTAQRLTTYSLALYGSETYLAAHGAPAEPAALSDHVLVGYVPEFVYAPELDYLSEIAPGLEPRIRSTSINVQQRIIAEGAGIGVLPRFMAASDARLKPVLSEVVTLERSFWLVAHSDTRRLARIEAVVKWLRGCIARIP